MLLIHSAYVAVEVRGEIGSETERVYYCFELEKEFYCICFFQGERASERDIINVVFYKFCCCCLLRWLLGREEDLSFPRSPPNLCIPKSPLMNMRVCRYTYIYMYRERERGREGGREEGAVGGEGGGAYGGERESSSNRAL